MSEFNGCRVAKIDEFGRAVVEGNPDLKVGDWLFPEEFSAEQRRSIESQLVAGRSLCEVAARIIQEQADSLKECHTVNDDWCGDVEAKTEYEYLTALCNRLTEHAQQLRGGGE